MEKKNTINNKVLAATAALGLVGLLYGGALWFAQDQRQFYTVAAAREILTCQYTTCRDQSPDSPCLEKASACWHTESAQKRDYWSNIEKALAFYK